MLDLKSVLFLVWFWRCFVLKPISLFLLFVYEVCETSPDDLRSYWSAVENSPSAGLMV